MCSAVLTVSTLLCANQDQVQRILRTSPHYHRPSELSWPHHTAWTISWSCGNFTLSFFFPQYHSLTLQFSQPTSCFKKPWLLATHSRGISLSSTYKNYSFFTSSAPTCLPNSNKSCMASRPRKDQILFHTLRQREIGGKGRGVQSATILTRQLYSAITPNETLYKVELPDGFLPRRFTPNGKVSYFFFWGGGECYFSYKLLA
jgi:hypothetical protein